MHEEEETPIFVIYILKNKEQNFTLLQLTWEINALYNKGSAGLY